MNYLGTCDVYRSMTRFASSSMLVVLSAITAGLVGCRTEPLTATPTTGAASTTTSSVTTMSSTTTIPTTTSAPTTTSTILASGPWSVVADHRVVGRVFPIVVWTGSEVVVWGGEKPSEGAWHADGAAFNPATGTWRELADSPLASRSEHVAVWTGEEVLICCGRIVGSGVSAGAYDPEADQWREISAPPISSAFAEAVWTGEEMLVFGGVGGGGTSNLVGAAAFKPVTDSWRRLADLPYGLERTVDATMAMASSMRGPHRRKVQDQGPWPMTSQRTNGRLSQNHLRTPLSAQAWSGPVRSFSHTEPARIPKATPSASE